jgi:hypothetical protein
MLGKENTDDQNKSEKIFAKTMEKDCFEINNKWIKVK